MITPTPEAPDEATAPKLTTGTRFRAFPKRQVLIDGVWVTAPTYRVTAVRHYPAEDVIYYRVDDHGTNANWFTPVDRLRANGLEVLP